MGTYRVESSEVAVIDVEWDEIDGHGVLVCRTDDTRLPWSDDDPGTIECENADPESYDVGALVDWALPEGWALCKDTAVEHVGRGSYFVWVEQVLGDECCALVRGEDYVVDPIETDEITALDMREMLDSPHAMAWSAYHVLLLDEHGDRQTGDPIQMLTANRRGGICWGSDTRWTDDGDLGLGSDADYREEPEQDRLINAFLGDE